MKKICVIIGVLIVCILSVVGVVGMDQSTVYADTTKTMEIQRRLKELGYYDGSINGYFDDLTVVAIKNFQKDNGIYVSGAVGGITASALGIYMSEQESNDLYLLAKCIHAEARGAEMILEERGELYV